MFKQHDRVYSLDFECFATVIAADSHGVTVRLDKQMLPPDSNGLTDVVTYPAGFDPQALERV